MTQSPEPDVACASVTDESDVPAFPSFVGGLGVEMWIEDGCTHGRAEVRPEMLAPGRDRLRVGVLATLVDMVAGSLPHGAINPTVDLRVSVVDRPPVRGTVHLVCRPAKLGRRLFVGETLIDAGDPDRPFARSIVTFMNELIPESFDVRGAQQRRRWAHRRSTRCSIRATWPTTSSRCTRTTSVRNGPAGTIQGGAQSLLAEIAAERALASRGEFDVADLDIRFLNRVRTGPVVATAEVLPDGLDGIPVRVPITEPGADSRIVSLVTLRFRAT